MKKRILAILCAVALLLSMAVLPASAATYTYTYTSSSTGAPTANTDYSFAVIGDMQRWTELDQESNGTTEYTKTVFDWLLQNKEQRNIEYVFGLGDTVDTLISWPENGYNTSVSNPKQWQVAATQFARLDGIIPYMVIRGNHDDEAGFHNYICTDDYKNQMSGFFYDPDEPAVYGNSMSNAYQKIEIGGVKYLMLGLDFHLHATCIDGNPCDNSAKVLTWANNVIAANPDYRIIVSVHVYKNADGSFYSGTVGEPGTKRYDTWPAGYDGTWHEEIDFSGQYLWDNLFMYHENIFMVMSGHVVTQNPYFGTKTDTKHNNSVFEVVLDPSNYVTDDNNNDTHIMMLNFDEDGNVLGVEYLSPSRALRGEAHYVSGNQRRVSYSDVGVVDLENAFADLGHKNVYLGTQKSADHNLDGNISGGEYSVTRTIKQDGPYAQNLESDLIEYMSHDNDYIYYGFTVKQTATERATQLQFRVQNSYAFPQYLALHNRHVTTSFVYNESTGSIEYGTNDSNQPGVSAPVWGTDIWAAATKDANGYKTAEIKISKDYFVNQLGIAKEDLKYVAYTLYLHTDSSGAQQWNAYKVTSSEQAVLTDLGVTKSITNLYHLMILEDDPNGIEKTISLSTLETASTRISTENPGLRFKTRIAKAELQELVNKFGAENVSVGTLIAPTDTLGEEKLTHAFGDDGIDYIDVKAKVDKPFADEDGILTYAGTISNIAQKNLGRDFTAVGYISYVNYNGKTEYIYSTSSAVRNVNYVATEALKHEPDANLGDTPEQIAEARRILEALTVKYYTDIKKDPFETDPF